MKKTEDFLFPVSLYDTVLYSTFAESNQLSTIF